MGESQKVRAALDHPVIDVDGHVIEFMPAILPFVREALGPAAFDRYLNQPSPIARILPLPWLLPTAKPTVIV